MLQVDTKDNDKAILSEGDRRKEVNRRIRRQAPKISWKSGGQRLSGRRQGDLINAYVDRYSPQVRYFCVGLLCLSILDAFFTIRILEKGGVELNPFMDALIAYGIGWFVFIKMSITVGALSVLLVFYHFTWLRVLRVAHIIYVSFAVYLALIQYELGLLWTMYYG